MERYRVERAITEGKRLRQKKIVHPSPPKKKKKSLPWLTIIPNSKAIMTARIPLRRLLSFIPSPAASPTLACSPFLLSKSFASSSSVVAPSDLFAFNPTLDIHPADVFTPPLSASQKHPTKIVYVTNPEQTPPSSELLGEENSGEDDIVAHLASVTEMSPGEIKGLYRFPLIVKRVVSMKSKGKMPSMYALVVVGNGNGLVGVGEGNGEAANRAVSKAFSQAVRSMDYVERYDDRTVWGEMESNFGSCKIQMRSRPPGLSSPLWTFKKCATMLMSSFVFRKALGYE